jgi:hypothetical protein
MDPVRIDLARLRNRIDGRMAHHGTQFFPFGWSGKMDAAHGSRYERGRVSELRLVRFNEAY